MFSTTCATSCLMLLVHLVMVFGNGQVNTLPNCAACFSQKWDWDSWQCDINCNVRYDPYALVDAFKAVYTTEQSSEGVTVSQFTGAFPFSNTPLNIHNNFNVATGKFTIAVPGIYQFSIQGRSDTTGLQFNLKVKKSGVESVACRAWTNAIYNTALCETLEEMDVGDEAFVTGQAGKVVVKSGKPYPTFKGHLVYRKQ